jgi:NADPH:quinone reductase-like Zn-dependent oxidoreductase
MQAIGEATFGGPIALMDLPTPEIGPGEVWIRVRAAGVNPFDWKVAHGALEDQMRHRFPLIPGFDAAGVIERVGADVTELAEGDEVYGYLFKPVIGDGTYAEYVSAPATIVAQKPVAVGFAEAAALPTPGLTAMDLVNAVDITEGETILIVGLQAASARTLPSWRLDAAPTSSPLRAEPTRLSCGSWEQR